jgi:hypothetical protein
MAITIWRWRWRIGNISQRTNHHVQPQEKCRDRENQMDVQTGFHAAGPIWRRHGPRLPPAQELHVDFESRHGRQQDDGQRQLNPLVPSVLLAKSYHANTDPQHWQHQEHSQKHDVEHDRRTGAQETIDAGEFGQGRSVNRQSGGIQRRVTKRDFSNRTANQLARKQHYDTLLSAKV